MDKAGGVQCWGSDTYRVLRVPNSVFTRLALGQTAACGVTTIARLECWGAVIRPAQD
jgi:hypothetical protein